MPWWGWILTGTLGAVVVLLVVKLLRQRPGLDRTPLADSERQRMAEELEAERAARGVAEKIVAKLEAELRGVAKWRREQLEQVDNETEQDRAKLAGDPDALLGRLDDILARGGD